jgi:hypothetical protein
MRNIEKIIKEVNGSMAMEGMPLTEDDKNRMRLCAGDRDKVDNMVSELIEKHRTKEIKSHEQRL